MKKIQYLLATLIAVILVLGLVACNPSTPDSERATEEATATVEDGASEEDTTSAEESTSVEDAISTEDTTETDETTSTDEAVPHTHVYGEWVTTKESACEEDGVREATCSCGDKLIEEIPTKGHIEAIDAAVTATCTQTGLTEGKHCTVCGTVIVKQETVAKAPHTYTWVVDKAATETETGIKHEECTCGAKCSENTVIPKKDCTHKMTKTSAVAATCTKNGKSEYYTCSTCKKIFADKNGDLEISLNDTVINALGHVTVTDLAVKPTCTSTGLTEGSHCSRCGTVFAKQETVAKLAHTYGTWVTTKAATCEGTGTKQKSCSCGDKITETIPAKGHTEVIDKAVAPTKTETGLTEGKHCSVCSKVLVKQEIVPATDSSGLAYKVNADAKTCTITGIGTCTDTKINIPEKIDNYAVVGIADSAFMSKSKITSVVIPEGVTRIGRCAFYGCTSLTSVMIPDGVTEINESTFLGCISLTDIIIPESVTSIGDEVFYKCTSLTSITIPDGVTNIGERAFYDCSSLTSIVIPSSVTSIAGLAFNDCPLLKTVHITNMVAWCSINFDSYPSNPLFNGANLYLNNKLVTDLAISDSIETIGRGAFSGCISLKRVIIPDSVTSIEDSAFLYCTSLENVIIGKGVTGIGDGAFSGCTSITSIGPTNSGASIEISSSVTSIENSAFRDCSSLISVVLPDSVTSIAGFAFENCPSLASVVLSDSLTNIGMYAFCGCTPLKNVVIPDSVTSLGDGAFSNCTSLESVVIPDSVTSIDVVAFNRCTSLKSIDVGRNNPNYSSIDGNLYNKNATTLIQYALGKTSASFTIPDSVTSISEGAFEGCPSLTSVVIGNRVSSIGDWAFSECTSLTSISFSDSVTSIGEWAFYDCKLLESIVIPNSVRRIGANAFFDCTSLTIYCEAESQPSSGWGDWNPSNRPVVLGYKGE